MTWNRWFLFTGLTIIWATTSAQSPTTASVYTETQAANGKKSYDQYCADCHHMSLKGTGHGPELAGPNFLVKWGARSTAKFISYNREFMPPEAAGSLSESMIVDIVAHIFRVNGSVAGDEALRTDSELLVGAAIGDEQWLRAQEEAGENSVSETKWESWQGAGTIAGAARKASGFVNREVRDFSPVTGQMLRQPPAADWLSWRRTLDGQGYSPLDQVNRETVSGLKLAWVLTMRDGSNQTTPLVHAGTMFLVNPENVVQAVDGATGDVIWEYAYNFPPAALEIREGGLVQGVHAHQWTDHSRRRCRQRSERL
jgi:alcohol dehydrogenase (cytochrome c)